MYPLVCYKVDIITTNNSLQSLSFLVNHVGFPTMQLNYANLIKIRTCTYTLNFSCSDSMSSFTRCISWVWYSRMAPRMWGLTNRALKREKIRNISLAFLAVPSWSRSRAVIRVSTLSILSSYLVNKTRVFVTTRQVTSTSNNRFVLCFVLMTEVAQQFPSYGNFHDNGPFLYLALDIYLQPTVYYTTLTGSYLGLMDTMSAS